MTLCVNYAQVELRIWHLYEQICYRTHSAMYIIPYAYTDLAFH